jgi:hypothetical protein
MFTVTPPKCLGEHRWNCRKFTTTRADPWKRTVLAEAAKKARAFEEQGDADQAKTWRDIEQALLLMRGPSVS